MSERSEETKTLWVLYENVDSEWWQPVRDGDQYEIEDLMERMKSLPAMLGKRILKLAITDYGKRPDERNAHISGDSPLNVLVAASRTCRGCLTAKAATSSYPQN